MHGVSVDRVCINFFVVIKHYITGERAGTNNVSVSKDVPTN